MLTIPNLLSELHQLLLIFITQSVKIIFIIIEPSVVK